jgi:hypothetical protein
MVPGNPPKPIQHSHRRNKHNHCENEKLSRLWDAGYRRRADRYKAFVVGQPIFIDLSWEAPIITDELLKQYFGHVPGTRNPGRLPSEHFDQFLQGVCPAGRVGQAVGSVCQTGHEKGKEIEG